MAASDAELQWGGERDPPDHEVIGLEQDRARAVSPQMLEPKIGLCASGKLRHLRILKVLRVRPADLRGFIEASSLIGARRP